MAEIIMKFNEEEFNDARVAMDGWKWQKAMWDLDQILRSTTKYSVSILKVDEASDEEIEVAQKIRDEIREILNDYNLTLED
jgi:hypothetical protein